VGGDRGRRAWAWAIVRDRGRQEGSATGGGDRGRLWSIVGDRGLPEEPRRRGRAGSALSSATEKGYVLFE
jgi:hypothetical protein